MAGIASRLQFCAAATDAEEARGAGHAVWHQEGIARGAKTVRASDTTLDSPGLGGHSRYEALACGFAEPFPRTTDYVSVRSHALVV